MTDESPINRFRRWAESDPAFVMYTRFGVTIETDDVMAMVGLAEALEEVLWMAESLDSQIRVSGDTDDPRVIAARAALSKARGETA